ncbi:hypothetical protein [Jejuia spongiicola]|uniref:Response regulator transcription factor n=1 Tax=Jejuia spongiicola TaxID=2942207 RepID=A0ABT0QFA2_9FLAO|nr:hypothetical protein [Jejuia spongiicola]MCL6294904.1 hypothetical protein [Jejuia spongiicola]
MNKSKSILIIENEALFSHSIESTLKTISDINFSIYKTKDYKAAYLVIQKVEQLDFVFFNVDLFPNHTQRYTIIEDLIATIRYDFTNAKLFLLTSYFNNYLILEMIKTFNPDSVILKSDINSNDLIQAVSSVIENNPFYSASILRLLRSQFSSHISIDKTDRLILYHLSRGIKSKDLPDLVFLSLSSIEKRKRNLKSVFKVDNDRLLLEEARNRGII